MNNKTYIKLSTKYLNFKKVISLLLALLIITSTFLTPSNLAYAFDHGEKIIKSITYSEAKKVVIDNNKITVVLPYGYEAHTLELDNESITYTFDSKFNVDVEDITFPSGSIADVDDSSLIMDILYSYVEDETNEKYETSYYVNVKRGNAPSFSGTIPKSTTLQKSLFLNYSDFSNLYKANDGEDMAFISISAPSNDTLGTLKLDGSNYEAGTYISVSDIKSGKLEFQPLLTGTISYTITAYAADESETNCGSATLTIKIETPVASTIKYPSAQDAILTFKLNDFTSACANTVGGTLDYIIPSIPASSNGKLYIDYVSSSNLGTLVTKGTKYDKTNISKMSFVPSSGYIGTLNIDYEGYNTEGAMFTGKIEITYTANPIDAAIIKYSTYKDIPIEFLGNDFIVKCKDTTGRTLDYIKFTLPSTSRGRLYLNYDTTNETKVSESGKYYKSDLDSMTFVPYSGYTGTVLISYVGYNDLKKSYTGEIEIKVADIVTDADPITYKTGSFTTLNFDSDDFALECKDTTGKTLDYVKFTIPSSTYGVMYSDYTSSTKYGSKVSSSTKYYKTELDKISFVPKSSFSGVVLISYTGYNTSGKSYTGVVKITVTKEAPVAKLIKISTKEDTSISLTDKNFNDVCKAATGGKLEYVKFTLPATKYGKLYYKYTSATKYDSEVSANTKYYYESTPYLYNITFVPYKDYYGTVTVNYTGWDINGDTYSGSVEIEIISMPETEGSLYFKDVTKDYAWAASQIDSLYDKSIVSGTGNNNYSPARNMIRGDFMLMLYRALNLSANTTGVNFSDVPKDSYYYKEIFTAKSLGIAKGYDNLFMPATGITREDAMVLVDRALTIQGKKLAIGSSSDLKIYNDMKSVSDYALTPVATLVKAQIIKGDNGYLNPKSFISRAEMAVILYRVLELK